MTVWILVAAVVLLLMWPAPQAKQKPSLLGPVAQPEYLDAVRALQLVRMRLAQTERLDAAAEQSIEALTLALIAGHEAK